MPDDTGDTGTQDNGQDTGNDAGDDTVDWQQRFETERANAQKWERRAKSNHGAVKELEELKTRSMTDVEKAVAEATAKARKEAFAESGRRLVDAEVKAAAAGRRVDVAALLDGLDRNRFLTDDGEPDTREIQKWVDRIVPPNNRPDPLAQGARGGGGGAPADMNALIRDRMRRG